jgi:phenylalanyl-tRNA synthetase beta chain
MKIAPDWIREFVDLKVNDRKLADDLTLTGTAVENIGQDGIFEMEITTNRPDCMNHYGVSRECSTIYDVALKSIEPKLPATKRESGFPIEIEDAQGCARYTARIIRGVQIGPSAARIAERLASVDQRSINNAADASNYTLWEMGHPTHAFDLDLLEGKIVVRRARSGETLKTLDGVDRKLSTEDLVIADAKKPVALAGIMGGFETMITERTKNILIESAWFDPVSVRKTSRRLGMHTDASHRFERGADCGATSLACARVAQLILESAGGSAEEHEIDVIARQVQNPTLKLGREEAKRILGKDFSDTEISRILTRLGFGVTPGRARTSVAASNLPAGSGGAHAAVAEQSVDFTVIVPTWRLDVDREIDLIEEIARIHGYNQFPNTLPGFIGSVKELPEAAKDNHVTDTMLALGYNQAITLTFISHEDAKRFSAAAAVELENPLSEEMSVMRNSLLPGMLDMLEWNLNRGNDNARLFEVGAIFESDGSHVRERRQLCLGATGSAHSPSVHVGSRSLSFFDVKGDLEILLTAFEHKELSFDSQSPDYYQPGASARALLDGVPVAHFGQINRDSTGRKIRQDVFVAEVFLDKLYPHSLRQPRYKALPRYPAVERDFSFIFDDQVSFERVQQIVTSLRLPELRIFLPVEIFRGGSIPADSYSILLRATFQSSERTLQEDEVAQWSAQIIQALQSLGGKLRAQ